MFGMFAKKPAEKLVVRDAVAQQLCDILFPKLTEETKDGSTFVVDRSVDSNLYAALLDLEEDVNDETVRITLRSILNKLYKARDLLEANYVINSEASHIIVDLPNKT